MILQFCTKYIMLQTTLIYIHKSFKEKFFFCLGGKGEIMPHHINMWLWSRDCIMYFQYNKKSICICKIMCSFPIHKGTISFLFHFFFKFFFTVTLLLNTMKAFQNDAKFVTYRKDSKFERNTFCNCRDAFCCSWRFGRIWLRRGTGGWAHN